MKAVKGVPIAIEDWVSRPKHGEGFHGRVQQRADDLIDVFKELNPGIPHEVKLKFDLHGDHMKITVQPQEGVTA